MTRRIVITSKDCERLLELIKYEREFGKAKNKDYLKDLEQELNLANIVASEKIPSSVIAMNSRILLRDINSGEEMSIDYITKSGYPISRTVRPIQMFMAGTGNNILLTMTREWNDYRAYIIDNIQSVNNEDENFQYLI